MKRIVFAMICVAFWASASNAEEWEGKKMLVEQRSRAISACEQGILSKGYPYAKVKKYCECSVNYMTDMAERYSKEELNEMSRYQVMTFLRSESRKMCIYHLK
jgi:hypothetical protein